MYTNYYLKINKSYLKYALNVGISLLILAFIFSKVPFVQVLNVIKSSRLHLFFLSVIVGILSILVSAWRWRVLLGYLGYKYDLSLLSRLAFMTLFFNIYIPSGVVGDVARVAILPVDKNSKEERKVHLSKIAASVVTDRIVGMMGLMLLAFIGFVFCYRLLLNSKILFIFGLFTFGLIAVFLILFSRRTQVFLKKAFAFPLKILTPVKIALKNVMEALSIYRENYSVFNKVIPISILAQLCVVSYFFLLAQSISVDISFLKLLAFVPLIEFVASIPISLGGVGIRDTATILLFSTEGISATEAMSISLLSFVMILLLGAMGGIFFLRWHLNKDRKEQ